MSRIVLPLALVITIFFASEQSQVAAPGFIPHVDKFAHLGAFGLLATLVLRAFYDERRPWRTALLAAGCVSLYGMTDEFHQSFTPGRDVEVADWVADTVGAILAVSSYIFLGWWRRFLERPLWRPALRPPSPTRKADDSLPVR